MRFDFKKVASVLASAVMLSSTIGFAAAASYPQPFVTGGTADGAVVVGANAAVSDWSAAIDVQTKLNALVTSGSTGSTTSGGDSFKFEKSSTKWHVGQGLKDIVSVSVTDNDLPTLLADGKYIDDDNDEFDYIQKIDMANMTLTQFDDNDYLDDTPTVGLRVASGSNVLNYTLDFTDEPLWTDITTTDVPILGRSYYVLTTDAPTNTSMTLLDSATDTVLTEGETATLTVGGKTYEASIAFVGSAEVKLTVNGETTNSLAESATYKLSDGAYVGIKDILYDSKTGTVSKVEFSIGSGKLKLTSGSDVELNDESVSNLNVNITSDSTGSKLSLVKITWDADEDTFVAPDSEPVMPGFGAVKLSFAGMHYPAEEEISVEAGSTYIYLNDFPLKDSTEDVYLLWGNGSNWKGLGKEAAHSLANSNSSLLSFDADTDDYFIASWSDGNDAESYLMRATNFKVDSGVNKTTFQYRKDGAWSDAQTDVRDADTFSLGNVQFTVGTVEKTAKTVNVTVNTNSNFHTLYSEEGLKVLLPYNATEDGETGLGGVNFTKNTTYDFSPTSYTLLSYEEDKDGNKGDGGHINLTLSWSDSETTVSNIVTLGDNSSFQEEGSSTKKWVAYMHSAVATKMFWDKGNTDVYLATLTYHGGESYGEVFITAPETTVSPGSTGGAGGQVLIVKDSEVSSVVSKNLLVVGGSCVNTVAAKILGSDSPLCSEDFTEKTGVASGQYIIKTVASPENAEKVAMLVAGYNAADTTSAVNKALEGVTTDKDTSQVYPIVGTA